MPISVEDILNFPAVRAVADPCAAEYQDQLGLSEENVSAVAHGIITVTVDPRNKTIVGHINTTRPKGGCPEHSVAHMKRNLGQALGQYIRNRRLHVGKLGPLLWKYEVQVHRGACKGTSDLVTLIQRGDLQPATSEEYEEDYEIEQEGNLEDDDLEEDGPAEELTDEENAAVWEEYEQYHREGFEHLSVDYDRQQRHFPR